MPGQPRRWFREAVSWLAFGAALTVARASFADHYRVPSGSMEPTVATGDHIVVAKASYGLRVPLTDAWVLRWSSPSPGDVVVLESPETDQILLKRVVAKAGQTVEVRGGKVRVDGRPERSAHPIQTEPTGGPDFGPVKVPAGKVLVLGDNRGNSRDGRYFGFVDVDTVLGRAEAVVARDGEVIWQAL
jgi:signal peptidase I